MRDFIIILASGIVGYAMGRRVERRGTLFGQLGDGRSSRCRDRGGRFARCR